MGKLVQCRDCGNPVSKSAKVCPKCGRPRRRSLLAFAIKAMIVVPLLFFALITLLGFLARRPAAGPESAPTNPARDEPRGMKIGAPSHPEVKQLLAATDRESDDAYTRALVAKDDHGKRELLDAGKVFLVDAGTECQVLESTLTMRRVRLLSGERTGQAAWIAAEFVVPR